MGIGVANLRWLCIARQCLITVALKPLLTTASSMYGWQVLN